MSGDRAQRWRQGRAALRLAILACLVAGPLAGIAPMARAATQCADAGPWCNTSLSPDQRAQLLLDHLTQSQKISLLAGDNLLGVTGSGHTGSSAGVPGLVPPLNFTDGTAGIRGGPTTAMPDELAVAASFDPGIANADGQVLGNEAKLKGNDVIFGPTLTIMRTPLAGRTFQALGEDPFLTSQMGVGLIDGIQSQGVIADANIYTANNQEGQDPTGNSGMPGSPLGAGTVGSRYAIDANVDQRTLREIYLPPFEAAVKQANVGTVMCAYNLVNGTYNCENGPLLNGILKQQWGFKGFVLSDYGAAHDTIASLQNGLDFEPWPGAAYGPAPVTAAVTSGAVSQSQLDDHVRRILRTLFAFGVFDRPAFTDDEAQIDKAAHAAAAERIEEGAITLLQNRDAILPLHAKRLKSIAVIGKVANSFLTGGGSSQVTPYSDVSPLQGIIARAGKQVRVVYNDGSDPASAAALAKSSSVAIVVAADYEIEGVDLQCLTLECPNAYGNQDSLISQVAAANPHTIVVLETGGPVLTPWRGQVKGLLEAWYPGEQGGTAIARVLFGDVDPSGHLPVTFPRAEADEPTAGDVTSYPGVADSETYKEGVFVGYRWFDAHRLPVAFPFGFGLSYTSFAYRDLSVKPTASGAVVSFTVRNVGARAGAAAAQLYLGLPAAPAVPQPPAQLKRFERVQLPPGKSAHVSLRIDSRALSYWDTATGAWRVAPGCYRVMVGSSSRELPLRGVLGSGGVRCVGARRR
ncbi:MAG TPA: glycoside hydrolase family 3 C-terminal domain-containing protein [Solirubrobacteraceae bacterium]|nr:glycoside hydrolase family 3 C-terminal domain-containing protein [Solirubrobacteraceae bacterium]